MTINTTLKADLIQLMLMLTFWAVAIIFISPVGNFPLNDDWHYGHPVLHLFDEGAYLIKVPVASNLFFQVAWGYLFCKIGGSFDFTWLRYSVIFWGILTTFSFYGLLRHLRLRSQQALGLALLLFFNPVFFSLSFTFMTDVPFLALAVLSILCYMKFLEEPLLLYRMGGFLMAILAFLVRQPGLLIPIAFELALLASRPEKRQWYYFLGTLFFLLLSYFIVEKIIKPAVGSTSSYISVSDIYLSTLLKNPSNFVFRLLKYNTMGLYYLGLFTA